MIQDTRFWDDRRQKIYSHAGGWKLGVGAYTYGLNLLDGAMGQYSYMQIHMRNTTGKSVDKDVAAWMEAVFICQSWPDARIWCNQIGALAGEAHCSPTSAATAGAQAACSEAYSGKTIIKGCEFMEKAHLSYQSGMSVEDIVEREVASKRGKAIIMGYTRPIAKGDERVSELWRVARELGFSIGPREKLALEIENYLAKNYDEWMNMCGCVASFMLDQGFTGKGLFNIMAVMAYSGVSGCYVDAIDRPQGSFLPLRCDDIIYKGKNKRPLP